MERAVLKGILSSTIASIESMRAKDAASNPSADLINSYNKIHAAVREHLKESPVAGLMPPEAVMTMDMWGTPHAPWQYGELLIHYRQMLVVLNA